MRYCISFFALCFLWVGCDNGSNPDDGLSVTVSLMGYDTVPDQSVTCNFDDYTSTTVDGREVVAIPNFITTTLIPKYDNKTPENPADDIDRRPIFGYRLVGSDGFSAHVNKGANDQIWDHMLGGYLAVDTRDACFEASLALPKYYSVKDIEIIEIYRKIDVILPDTSFQMEPAELTQTTFNGEAAVALTTLLGKVSSPETFKYNFGAIDNFSKDSTFTYSQMQAGYLLLQSDKLLFSPDLGGWSKIKNVLKITATLAN